MTEEKELHRFYSHDYNVHIEDDGHRLHFYMYQSYGEGLYQNKIANQADPIEFDKEKSLVKMQGSYCYRGVWEARLYFPDIEYWGSELDDLNKAYEETKKWCQQHIMGKETNTDSLRFMQRDLDKGLDD